MAVQLLYVQLSVIALHVRIILTFFCYSYKFFFFCRNSKKYLEWELLAQKAILLVVPKR